MKPIPDMTYNVFGGTLNLAQAQPERKDTVSHPVIAWKAGTVSRKDCSKVRVVGTL